MKGTYRAAVIGATGRGNYGHSLELPFLGLPGVETVALADPDETGRRSAAERAGAHRTYADYREMLERESPDVVSIAPYWFDEREAMVVATAQAGVKAILCQKPFARSLDEADRMLSACQERGVKLAVAHQNRVFPAPRRAQELIAAGKLGRLRMMRAFGKQDHRGGGIDLLILGTHLLDLMRLFAGDARWCHAHVAQSGHDATPADVTRPDYYQIGPVAGDDVVAQYGFDRGVRGTFESVRSDVGGGTDYFHLELCGTAGILALWSSPTSPVLFSPRPFAIPGQVDAWEDLTPEPLLAAGEVPAGTNSPHLHPANQLLVRDLLAAVESGREPLSSGHEARAALEMIVAVYESHIREGRVRLPLGETRHPLARWTA